MGIELESIGSKDPHELEYQRKKVGFGQVEKLNSRPPFLTLKTTPRGSFNQTLIDSPTSFLIPHLFGSYKSFLFIEPSCIRLTFVSPYQRLPAFLSSNRFLTELLTGTTFPSLTKGDSKAFLLQVHRRTNLSAFPLFTAALDYYCFLSLGQERANFFLDLISGFYSYMLHFGDCIKGKKMGRGKEEQVRRSGGREIREERRT